MRIAITANFDKEVRANTTGGSELFTYLLAKHLSRIRGVSGVRVVGVGKDHIRLPKVRFHSVLPVGSRQFIRQDRTLRTLNAARADFFSQVEGSLGIRAYQTLKDIPFDILQNNSTSYAFNALLGGLGKPVVTTMHTNPESPSVIIPKKLGLFGKNQRLVPISRHQIRKAKRLGIVTGPVVPNGVEISARPGFSTPSSSYALWVGRVSRKHDKGLREAVIAAKRARIRLIAIATIDDEAFYEESIKRELSPKVTIRSNVSLQEKNRLYRDAAFLLYPIQWEEPFGLVFLEAMRAGTPVIAFARGAAPEVIKDGATGFVVKPDGVATKGRFTVRRSGIPGVVEAIKRIRSLSPDKYRGMRTAAHARVENHYTVERMARDYFDYYRKLLKH
ncbi:MAG: glycosyltransferase [Patescibacteria group bacterium]